ncbi:MAG: DUF167 domain-containing protein [Candidatus Aenigmarchaeota archaeon]|nr:DUF167 domain-containing protein [Candidatus Aenigmarchaeota archaeon]
MLCYSVEQSTVWHRTQSLCSSATQGFRPHDAVVLLTGYSTLLLSKHQGGSIITECTGGVFLQVHVKTDQKKTKISVKNNRILVYLKNRPENNRANLELTTTLTKEFERPVFLVSGHKTKSKKLKINKITEEEAIQKIHCIARKE